MKRLFWVTLCLLLFLPLAGCKGMNNKAVIFFSDKKIDIDFTPERDKTVFAPGQKIYFVLYTQEPFTTDMMRVQVLKLEQKSSIYTPSLVQGRDIEIDMSMPYFTDSLVLYSTGYYLLRVFSKDRLLTPIAESDFKVE